MRSGRQQTGQQTRALMSLAMALHQPTSGASGPIQCLQWRTRHGKLTNATAPATPSGSAPAALAGEARRAVIGRCCCSHPICWLPLLLQLRPPPVLPWQALHQPTLGASGPFSASSRARGVASTSLTNATDDTGGMPPVTPLDSPPAAAADGAGGLAPPSAAAAAADPSAGAVLLAAMLLAAVLLAAALLAAAAAAAPTAGAALLAAVLPLPWALLASAAASAAFAAGGRNHEDRRFMKVCGCCDRMASQSTCTRRVLGFIGGRLRHSFVTRWVWNAVEIQRVTCMVRAGVCGAVRLPDCWHVQIQWCCWHLMQL